MDYELRIKSLRISEFQLKNELSAFKECINALETKCFVMNSMMDDMAQACNTLCHNLASLLDDSEIQGVVRQRLTETDNYFRTSDQTDSDQNLPRTRVDEIEEMIQSKLHFCCDPCDPNTKIRTSEFLDDVHDDGIGLLDISPKEGKRVTCRRGKEFVGKSINNEATNTIIDFNKMLTKVRTCLLLKSSRTS